MWDDILLSVGSSILEALCAKYMDKKRRGRFQRGLTKTINSLFQQYADTSLNCGEFEALVCNGAFTEMLQHYFFVLDDLEGKQTYLTVFADGICNQCPSVNYHDAMDFVRKLEEVYTSFLKKEIDHDNALSAMRQLLFMIQKQSLGLMLRSQEELKACFKAMHERSVEITNEDIRGYHQVCNREFGTVRFTGISGVENRNAQDINKFYVENTFSYFNPPDNPHVYNKVPDGPVCSLKDFFIGANKVVLIGDAGLGKSTSLNYLFCNYEKLYNSFALKLKINLKDYAGDISDRHRDILWCLATEFSKHIPRNKLTFEDISCLLDEYLQNGKCLVIFDALDEIPVQGMRNVVRNAISIFCEVYYLNRFIISSREVGYLKNRFDRDFIHIRINEFNMDQVKQYSRNWLSLNYQDIDFDQFWEKFSFEVERAKCQELIQNPIILILALVIFDIEKSLPNRRVEFYKKCIDTFLIVREDRKNAFIQTDDFRNILNDNSVVPKIAHYKFENIREEASYRFTSEELKNAVMQALDVPNPIQWRDPVAQFTKYLIDRTELIRETDEDNLDFTHKTFYEYFLAVYYAQECGVEELIKLLDEWIGDSNNDEMARLIIEVIVEKNNAWQHRTVMNHLLDMIEGTRINDDVFLIISELYNHNMLQAKYHDRYYNCILLNSRLTDRILNPNFRESGPIVRYDAQRMAELFFQNIEQDPSSLCWMITALDNLNTNFKTAVVTVSKDCLYQNIINLFDLNSWGHQNPLRHAQEQSILRDYFMIERFDVTLHYPEVYLSIIPMVMETTLSNIRKLFDFQFDRNQAYVVYLNPNTLYLLFNDCCKSPENMLLLLIVLIHCTRDNGRLLFRHILDSKGQLMHEEISYNQAIHIQRQSILVWENLFDATGFDNWKRWLIKNNLYLQEYERLYQKLCKERLSMHYEHWEEWKKRFQDDIQRWYADTESEQIPLIE